MRVQIAIVLLCAAAGSAIAGRLEFEPDTNTRLARNAEAGGAGVADIEMPLPAPCPPPGYTRESLLQLRVDAFEIADAARRDALALGLASCTGDPDPAIRDAVAFEGLSTWLRASALTAQTVFALRSQLLAQLADSPDAAGFRQPFAALMLSEVARTDRIEPSFTPKMRAELADTAANYLAGVRDYRGYSDSEGWRHGVAHGSDLVLQLALNPAIGAAELQPMMAAVFSQVAPEGEIFYVYGEPERLARAAFHGWQRGLLADAAWLTWFEQLADPAPHSAWGDTFSSQAGLAKRHNTQAFLLALHLHAVTAGEESGRRLKAMVETALSAMQ